MIKNRIIYGILVVSSALLAYYIPNLITSIYFHTVIFLMIVSLAHLAYSYFKIKLAQTVEPKIVEHGLTAEYSCEIFNEADLPTSIIKVNFMFNSSIFREQLEPQTFTLLRNKSTGYEYQLLCRYRGIYAVGIETIEISDILNIFKLTIRNIRPEKKITVLPKITLLPDFALSPLAESENNLSELKTSKDADSLVDIRKYMKGDALKRIHWKLSARHNELLVRNMERSAQNATLMFLDTTKGEYSLSKNIIVEDKLMEALASITNNLLLKNHSVELNYYEFDDVCLKYYDKRQFHDFFVNIASVLFRHTKNIDMMLNDYFAKRRFNTNLRGKDIFVFTCHPEVLTDNPIIHKLLSYQCSVNIVSSSIIVKKDGSYTTSEGINYYNLTPTSNLQDIFVRSRK